MHLLMGNSHVDVGSITLFSSTFFCHCCCIFYTLTIMMHNWINQNTF